MPRHLNRRLVALVLAAATALGLAACTSSPAADDGPAASVSAASGPTKFRGLQYQTPLPRPSFTLTDQTGAPYDFAAKTNGKPTLLYFGYTNCPDVCPTIMAAIATALAETPDPLKTEIQVVFVTTDPARDTPAVLAEYVGRFDGALPVKFIGLTGTLAEVEAAQTAAGVPVAEDQGQTHSTLVNYYGRSNKAQVAFLAGAAVDDIVHDLPLGAS